MSHRHLAASLLLVSIAAGVARAQAPQGPPYDTRGTQSQRTAAPGARLRQPVRVANQLGPPVQEGDRGPTPQQQPPRDARPPFVLNAAQQQMLDRVLNLWEAKSKDVKTFKCHFTRWEYDPTFGPNGGRDAKTQALGEIGYMAPDCGVYRVTEMTAWNAQKKAFEPIKQGLEYWVCDGKSIFEFAAAKRQLIVRPIPPAMQGNAITEGPIPFIFGAKADKLKQRYFLRESTPSWVKNGIMLEAYPRFQRDAANFQRAELILSDPDFLPYALQIYLPDGKTRTVYQFDQRKANGFFDKFYFRAPSTPLGWKKVVDAAPPPADQPSRQARRTSTGSAKK